MCCKALSETLPPSLREHHMLLHTLLYYRHSRSIHTALIRMQLPRHPAVLHCVGVACEADCKGPRATTANASPVSQGVGYSRNWRRVPLLSVGLRGLCASCVGIVRSVRPALAPSSTNTSGSSPMRAVRFSFIFHCHFPLETTTPRLG